MDHLRPEVQAFHMTARIRPGILLTVLAISAAGCGGRGTATNADALEAQCIVERSFVPSDAWICGQDRTIDCTGPTTDVHTIYVLEPTTFPIQLQCLAVPVVSDPGPFAVGDHTITVHDAANGSVPICTSHLRVVDRKAPAAEPHALNLWPPNHKYHTIGINDCVTVHDSCDPSPHVAFTYVESDEAVLALGSGHTDPDVILACDQVQVRSERQGPSNGRVYTLGWRATDTSGNSTSGTCTVSIVHDQSGRPAVPGRAAYRIDAPSACSAPPAPMGTSPGTKPGSTSTGGTNPGGTSSTPGTDGTSAGF
jgi:hypothetical protein